MEYIRIKEFTSVITGGTPSTKKIEFWDSGKIPWLNSGELNQDIVKTTRNYITEIGLNKSAAKLMPKDTVLIALTGSTTGVVGYLTFEASANQSVTGILPSKKHVPKYLFYYLKSIRPKVLHDAYGGAQPHISQGYVKELKIPLPPLEQQKKIAAILDAADTYRQKTKALITKYDALTQSLFLDMFGDPVKNPKGWETQSIVELVKDEKYSLKRGPFGGALKKEIFVEEGYLVYEQFHALNNDFSMARYFIDEEKYNKLIGFAVKPKDIIISCSGVYLGKLAIIPDEAKEGIINQALLKLTLDQSKMRNDFFVFHFTQENFKKTYFDSNRGAGIPNFPPMKVFKQFPFITPPIKHQNQFSERVKAIEAQKALAQQEVKKADNLFNSLLQKAFKGELTK
jgi:type I restriction enzyme S subunit